MGLDDPGWTRLRHAYGPAADVPPLLRRLQADPAPKGGGDDEPWFSLWSALCHQGDAYSASYAAVPHVVGVGLAATGRIDAGFFLLPACIEIARATGRGPVLEPALAASYLGALRALHDCAHAHADDVWSGDMAQAVAAALAASKGQVGLAQALVGLDEGIIGRIIACDL